MTHEERLALRVEQVQRHAEDSARRLEQQLAERPAGPGEPSTGFAERSARLAVWIGLCRRFGLQLDRPQRLLASPPVPRAALCHVRPAQLRALFEATRRAEDEAESAFASLWEPAGGTGSEALRRAEQNWEGSARRWILLRDEMECVVDSLRPVAREQGEIRADLMRAMADLGAEDERVLAHLSALLPAASWCVQVQNRARETGQRLHPRECWWWYEPVRAHDALDPAVTASSDPGGADRCPVQLPAPDAPGLAAATAAASLPPDTHAVLPIAGLPAGVRARAALTRDGRHLSVLFTDEAGRPTTAATGRTLRLEQPATGWSATAVVRQIEATISLEGLGLERLTGCRLRLEA
ncbi:MAG: hypothetical protein D6776_03000 [Planctomycetota bacterium]|nr:MAG: hypothetical protein D6776_03000 [Planctomycetota bacterium]